jgi:hypothetical protein
LVDDENGGAKIVFYHKNVVVSDVGSFQPACYERLSLFFVVKGFEVPRYGHGFGLKG